MGEARWWGTPAARQRWFSIISHHSARYTPPPGVPLASSLRRWEHRSLTGCGGRSWLSIVSFFILFFCSCSSADQTRIVRLAALSNDVAGQGDRGLPYRQAPLTEKLGAGRDILLLMISNRLKAYADYATCNTLASTVYTPLLQII